MKKTLLLTAATVAACAFAACDRTSPSQARNLERAKATLDSVYASYGVADRCLLRENYPFNADYKAGYLASDIFFHKSWFFGNRINLMFAGVTFVSAKI